MVRYSRAPHAAIGARLPTLSSSDPRTDPVISPELETPYRRFVQDAFGQRRKQMRRVLRSLWSLNAEQADALLAAAGLDPTARPEALAPADFAALLGARAVSDS